MPNTTRISGRWPESIKLLLLACLAFAGLPACAVQVQEKEERACDFERNAESIFYPSVMVVTATGGGSGVITGNERLPNGEYKNYVLTAKHVIDDVTKNSILRIKVFDFKESATEYQAELVNISGSIDVAILSFNSKIIMPVAKVAENDAKLFEKISSVTCQQLFYPIWVPGYIMLEFGIMGETSSAYYMFNMPITFGSSGGPIYNTKNEVVGIVNFMVGSHTGPLHYYGGGLKISKIREWAKTIQIEKAFVRQAYKGDYYYDQPNTRSQADTSKLSGKI